MPRPGLQRAATAWREKVQLRIREQSFDHVCGTLVGSLGKEMFRTPIPHTGTCLNMLDNKISTLNLS